MKLIIGGAYQGKRRFAQDFFGIKPADIFTCEGTEIDFSKICVDKIEAFTYACTLAHVDALEIFQANREQWKGHILICQDIFCGVVPLDGVQRAWRQNTGVLCQYLAGEAESVHRVFCGLEQRLK